MEGIKSLIWPTGDCRPVVGIRYIIRLGKKWLLNA